MESPGKIKKMFHARQSNPGIGLNQTTLPNMKAAQKFLNDQDFRWVDFESETSTVQIYSDGYNEATLTPVPGVPSWSVVIYNRAARR